MYHDGPKEGFCYQPTNFYLCKCLFDDMVKIRFSQLRSHEEIVISLTNQSRYLYLVSLKFLRAVMFRSCAGAFTIMAGGKRICSNFKAELNIDDKIKVSCWVKCLRTAMSKHFYIVRHIAM